MASETSDSLPLGSVGSPRLVLIRLVLIRLVLMREDDDAQLDSTGILMRQVLVEALSRILRA
jgi:hypothetical protein